MTAWCRLPEEPPGAYKRFGAYLELGPGRSLPVLFEALRAAGSPVRMSTLETQCHYWHWPERAAAYDRAQRPAEPPAAAVQVALSGPITALITTNTATSALSEAALVRLVTDQHRHHT